MTATIIKLMERMQQSQGHYHCTVAGIKEHIYMPQRQK